MATTRHMTLEEFLAMPDTEPASEFACGEAVQKPMPDNAHAILQPYLWMLIYQFLSQARLGRVRTEWRCIFGPPKRRRAYVPDVVYVSFERMPPGDTRVNRYVRTAPDLIVEVLSPDQPVARFTAKIQFYLRHGVRMVWVVNPQDETIMMFQPGEDDVTLRVGDTLDGGDVLPGFTAGVDDIMAQLRETEPPADR
jgi:Uma2 family endonuclease